MAITREIDGTLKMYQGDTGAFIYDNVPTDKNYMVFCEIRNRNGQPVGTQLMVESEGSDTVTFYIDDVFSDKLIVPFGRKFEPYSYGIKICDPETYSEDTVNLLGIVGKACRIIVYPKQAEGIGVVGKNCPVPPSPPPPPIKPIPYGPHVHQGYDLRRMVTKEELARKLATKVSEEEFANLSADVVLLAQKLATHIEEADARIDEKVTEAVKQKVNVIIDDKLSEYVKQDDLKELDNRYLQFEQVEDVED